MKNNQCVEINIPENASASIMGGWQCNTGYRKDGDKCDKVQLPSHANFTFGDSWSCNQGYKRSGDKCIKVQLPDNAHFTFGSVWECNAGFTKNGNSCRAMNRNELVEQVKLLNQMLIIQMSKSSGGRCSSGFDECEDECDDQFSSYYDEKNALKHVRKARMLVINLDVCQAHYRGITWP
ncbi:hypothetical protein [Salinivibrio sp. MA427]|uniref:hypothetical protein n=1 Tax=Salinivibrio sp. MA427 TaxID=1909455 RepID=UPI0018FE28CC|nr:hypothetical protein [Salinivibrio sp. MA427]